MDVEKTNVIDKTPKSKVKIDMLVLSLYFILTPFEYTINFGEGTLLKYIAGLFILLCFIRILISPNKFFNFNPIFIAPLMMIMLSYLSLMWTIDYEQSIFINRTNLFLQLLFIFVFKAEYNEKEINIIKNGILWGGILGALYIFIPSFQLLKGQFETRIAINDADPNEFAALLLLPFYITLGRVVNRKNIFNLIILGVVFFVILLTGSRGAMIAIVISTLIFLYNNFNKKNVLKYALLGILFFFIINFFLPEFIFNRLWGNNLILEEVVNREGRSYIWEIVVNRIIPDLSLIGNGGGSTGATISPYFGYPVAAHNTYLSLIIDYGILGLPIFLYFLWYIYKKIIFERDYVKLSLFIAILIIIFFLDAYFKKYLWNILMFCVISNSLMVSAKRKI